MMLTSTRLNHAFGKTVYLLAILWGLAAARASAAEPETRIGVAAVEITPPLGMPMAGYYHERGADGVLDPLFSKAMVIERGGEQVAFVVLDIISVTRSITVGAREEIERETGIPPEHVMVSATHAHTGPELAKRTNREADAGGREQRTEEYTRSLPSRIGEAVRLAVERLQPACLKQATGRCEDVAFNRRFFMRDGSVGWNPGRLNPRIMLPAGPTDSEVGVLYAEEPSAGGPAASIATYVNFALHPDTTGGSRFSADWPGALSRVLASYHGPEHFTLVANGACGNINHIDVSWRWRSGGSSEQSRIGTILGASVFRAYKSLRPVGDGPIGVRSETVELALREVTEEQVAEARETLEATKDDRGVNFMKLVRSYRVLDVAGREGEPFRVEVQAICLGRDVAWIGLPGEVFVELGLAVKKRSAFPLTLVVELANENIGYIPDRRSYAEGNYEPESARCAPGSGEKLADVAAGLLAALYEESVARAGEVEDE